MEECEGSVVFKALHLRLNSPLLKCNVKNAISEYEIVKGTSMNL